MHLVGRPMGQNRRSHQEEQLGSDSQTHSSALEVQGFAAPGFERVAETFAQQVRRSSGGAAVAAYHRGDLVVDLWGGQRTDDTPWESDTLAMCFSTTKGVASTALHVLAGRGLVDYDEPVATYWPEFAQGGKEHITVRQLMSHSAGLHRLRSIVDRAERMLDWDYMVDALARAEPAYRPGTSSGYHALTYGWLVGELVGRVSGRPIAEVVRDELAVPLGCDGLYLGCPPEERHRVAPLVPMRLPRLPKPIHQMQKAIGTQMGKVISFTRSPLNPRRMINALAPRGMEDILWRPEVMDASIPAANGFFTARSLARMYGMLAGGGEIDGVRLMPSSIVDLIGEVQTRSCDRVLVVPMGWRLGYHQAFTTRGSLDGAFGHFGFGGSGGWADPGRNIALAMVCNRGTGTPIGDLRLLQLGTATVTAARRRDAAMGADEVAA
jgi:CubicO group peptidase (beta-lactamase class C family)